MASLWKTAPHSGSHRFKEIVFRIHATETDLSHWNEVKWERSEYNAQHALEVCPFIICAHGFGDGVVVPCCAARLCVRIDDLAIIPAACIRR